MFCLLSLLTILTFIFFDVHYFVRVIFTVFYGRLFQKRGKVTDPTTIHGFCFTQDLDIVLKHMNNARFVRELDFARFHFYDRTGLYGEMVKRRTDAVQAATNIRYRRVIPLFSAYKVVTQLIYWEDKSFYLEQRFITNDGFIRAIVLSKQTMHKSSADEIMQAFGSPPKPEMTSDLELWIKSIDASSDKLKKETKRE